MTAHLRSSVVPVYVFLCILLGGSVQGIWGNMILQLIGIAIIAWSFLSPGSLSLPQPATALFGIATVPGMTVA